MRTTQAKQVAKLADPREEANLKWKKMKKQRDERNASIERRKNRDAMMYNFTRVVLNTEQAEFHRAYRDQYMQREYAVQRQHQERTEDRRRLDERMEEQLTTKRRQQQTEGKFMRTMLRESANKARAAIWEEVSINRMNNELNGTVSRSQSCLDVSSSSKVHIPEQLKNKMKTARRYNTVLRHLLVSFLTCFRSSQFPSITAAVLFHIMYWYLVVIPCTFEPPSNAVSDPFPTVLRAVWRASRRRRSRSRTTTRPPCPAASQSTRARATPPSARPASQVT
jgi:hypothetical protein